MDIKIMEALIELVKQGGTLALWGIGLWGLIGILKLSITGGVIWLIWHSMTACFKHYWDSKLTIRTQNISLISKEVSDKLSTTLSDFRSEVKNAMSDFLKESNNLLTKLKQNQNIDTKK